MSYCLHTKYLPHLTNCFIKIMFHFLLWLNLKQELLMSWENYKTFNQLNIKYIIAITSYYYDKEITFHFQCCQIWVNFKGVPQRSNKCGKSNIVPWKYLTISCKWYWGTCGVWQYLFSQVIRFLSCARALCKIKKTTLLHFLKWIFLMGLKNYSCSNIITILGSRICNDKRYDKQRSKHHRCNEHCPFLRAHSNPIVFIEASFVDASLTITCNKPVLIRPVRQWVI